MRSSVLFNARYNECFDSAAFVDYGKVNSEKDVPILGEIVLLSQEGGDPHLILRDSIPLFRVRDTYGLLFNRTWDRWQDIVSTGVPVTNQPST